MKEILNLRFVPVLLLGILFAVNFIDVSATAALTSTTPIPPPPGMVSWWPGDGNGDDLIGGQAVVPQGTASFDVGKIGQAFTLNNAADAFHAPGAPIWRLQELTVVAWVRATGTTQHPTDPLGGIVAVKVLTDFPHVRPFNSWWISYQPATGQFSTLVEPGYTTGDASEYLQSATGFAAGQFHHVAMTYDGMTLKLYVNGVFQGDKAISGPIAYSDKRLGIGAHAIGNSPFGRTLFGEIDEVAIFDRALSQAEIQSIFNAGGDDKIKPTKDLHVDDTIALGQGRGGSGQPSEVFELIRGDDPGTLNPDGIPNNGLLIQSPQTVEINIDSNDHPMDMFAITRGSIRQEVFRVEGEGNVGIGQSNPTAISSAGATVLHVGDGSRDAEIQVDGTDNTKLLINADADGGGDFNNSAAVGTITNSPLQFSINGAFKMGINTNGDVGIGTTNPTEKLTVSGNVLAEDFLSPSSKRWKTNIEPIEGALDKVQRLRGVAYDWKSDGRHDIGLIAEEVGEVVPEVVAYEVNGVDAKAVDYAKLMPVLIEAVKELDKKGMEITALREEKDAEIAALQGSNADLQARLAVLEEAMGVEASDVQMQLAPFDSPPMWMLAGGLGLLLVTPGLVLGYRRFRRDE